MLANVHKALDNFNQVCTYIFTCVCTLCVLKLFSAPNLHSAVCGVWITVLYNYFLSILP